MPDDSNDLNARSVLTVIAARTGEVPRVALNEEDSGRTGSPLIDPGTEERKSLPQGRDNYQIMGEIARGGMGVVLKGHDTDLGRDVAMKVMHRDFKDRSEILQRFVEEAQIGGQLQHPGIVPVYELGLLADQRPYFTMKLVKGRTLSSLLAERESPASERRHWLDIFESICQTMAYAHSRGVIHRDLKPANVMVGAFGEVQVVDWGLAKVLARGGKADERKARAMHAEVTILETVRSSEGSSVGSDSMVGSVMGTPAYMPPEQASGLVDRLDERSDVFSLGAILCEILTGKPPYAKESEETLALAAQAELDDALERLDSCAADIELVKLTKECLVAAPAARPRNAGVLAERIHRYLVSVEERAHAARIEVAVQRKARKLTGALAATVLVAALGGGGVWLWIQQREVARERALAEQQRGLVTSVNAALGEASLFQGQELWTAALAAVDRARALAGTGAAATDLAARIDETEAGVRADAETARRRAELQADTRALLNELYQTGQGIGVEGESLTPQEIEPLYAAVFDAHGIDIEGASPEETAAALKARGLGEDLARGLDRWLAVRRVASPMDEEGALHLVEIAHLIDPDPLRADLREAMINSDAEALRWLAADDLADQPPTTLLLLAQGLDLLRQRDEALRIARAGIRWYPDDVVLRTVVANWLVQANEYPEALRHLDAALALRPDAIGIRSGQFLQTYNTAMGEKSRGEVERAKVGFNAAAAAGAALVGEDVPAWVHVVQASALTELGQVDTALVSFRRATEVAPEDAWALEQLGLALWRGRKHDEALATLERGRNQFSIGMTRGLDLLSFLRVWRIALDGDVDAAVESCEAVIAADPRDRDLVLNNFAWRFASTSQDVLIGAAPDGPRRERAEVAIAAVMGEALRMTEEAVELDQWSAEYWNTLGVLRYRLDDPEGAIDALMESVRMDGEDAHDLFVLAMAQHELGNAEQARRSYERGFLWMRENAPLDGELRGLRGEAEELLGIGR